MMHRDRAWRRRKTRLTSIREDHLEEQWTQYDQASKATPHEKPHQHGKLTPTQSLRLNSQLNNDLAEAWTGDPFVSMESPPGPPPTHPG